MKNLLPALLLLIAACNTTTVKTDSEASYGTDMPLVTADSQAIISDMGTLPDQLDGCACYYSRNPDLFKNKKYVVAFSYNGNAYLMVNGELQEFKNTSSEKGAEGFEFKRYESPGFILMIQTKAGDKTGDEVYESFGNMTLVNKTNNKTQTIQLHGECGC